MIKKVIIPVLVLIVVVALAAYFWNGGFTKVEVTEEVSTQKWIVGRAYTGPVRSVDISELFQQAAELLESSKLEGHLGNMYYNNPSDAKGELKAFIGVVVT